jgi:hypothetical protein
VLLPASERMRAKERARARDTPCANLTSMGGTLRATGWIRPAAALAGQVLLGACGSGSPKPALDDADVR